MSGHKHPIFFKSLYGVVTIIILSTVILVRGSKTKNEFLKVSGRITYLDQRFQEWPNRDFGKYRYLQIDRYPKVFEIFIGKETGDFKPKFERIDQLKVGDIISAYYDEESSEEDLRINRLVQFIDKESEPFYIKGDKDKIGGMIGVGVGVFILLGLIYLKKAGKIE